MVDVESFKISFISKKLIYQIPEIFLVLFCVFLITINETNAQVINVNSNHYPISIGANTSILIDTNRTFTLKEITTSLNFKKSEKKISVFQVNSGIIWVKFSLTNTSNNPNFFLSLQYANISNIEFYKTKNGFPILIDKQGNALQYYKRKTENPYYIFTLNINPGDTATYFIKIKSSHPVLLPLFIENNNSLERSLNLQSLIIGIYLGIISGILLYNLFLFISTKDKSYFIYIAYLLFLGLAQLTLSGYAFRYLWPEYPSFNLYALPVTSCLTGILGILFAMYFLQIKKYLPNSNLFLKILISIFFLGIVLSYGDYNSISYDIVNYISLLGGVVLIFASLYIARKGYKSAYFYLIAWITFLIGMIVFVLRNLNILPYNNITTYITYFGSAIEAILLSIALADKINILRKEKETSQAEALRVSRQNATLIQEQNIVLEQKVSERTEELEAANDQLSQTLNDLKEAQTQLVEAEKMASLGQLTAGIAHEINNPINFVKSNIKPLQLDINDLLMVIDEYDELHNLKNNEIDVHLKRIDGLKNEIDLNYIKTEIKKLIKGIEEGAERTAEIVRGLRTFSRLDESELKVVNIHEGIDSTLVLLKNSLPFNLKIIKNFTADGNIECYPGKLNQVFMNIINNGIQAIQEKKERDEAETITLQTRDVNSKIEISIKDSGIGMTEEVKQKIFEPFFTTKDVGEGTGLGMAIVFKIIEKHNAKINIVSSPGNGAEFILTLPYLQPAS